MPRKMEMKKEMVALNAGGLLEIGLLAAVALVLHNSPGLSGGYWCGRLLGLDPKQSRIIAIAVGMRNSGLASKWGKR